MSADTTSASKPRQQQSRRKDSRTSHNPVIIGSFQAGQNKATNRQAFRTYTTGRVLHNRSVVYGSDEDGSPAGLCTGTNVTPDNRVKRDPFFSPDALALSCAREPSSRSIVIVVDQIVLLLPRFAIVR